MILFRCDDVEGCGSFTFGSFDGPAVAIILCELSVMFRF